MQRRIQLDTLSFTTASLHGSKDALATLKELCTPASLLFDLRFTSLQPPNPLPPFRTFPPSPTAQRIPYSLPSTISFQTLDTEEPPAEMDKRHPSSFQQLEKLGEGTYATVSLEHESVRLRINLASLPRTTTISRVDLLIQRYRPAFHSLRCCTVPSYNTDSHRSSKDEIDKLASS